MFDNLTLKQAREMVPQAEEWQESNEAFYRGDHWQNGLGWSGPMLESTHRLYQETMVQIRRGFVSKNVVKEIVGRHVAGVVGREPAWVVTVRRPLGEEEQPTGQEQALIAEAESLLVSWWDGQQGALTEENEDELAGVHKTIQAAVAKMLLTRRGALRLFVPPGELNEAGQVPRGTLEESIRRIYVHQPAAEQATVKVDRARMDGIGVYLYQEGREERAELTYLNGAATVVRIVKAGDEDATIGLSPLKLGGRLTMYEMRRPLLVTEQVRQLQKALNLGLTMMQRNVVQAGFLERTFFNTQLPGKNVPDPDRPGQVKFVPEPLHVGSGVTNFLSGVSYEDAEGNTQVATPSVVYRDPVSVAVFEATERSAYRGILEEVQQGHALLAGEVAPSGESRRQARSDFEESLLLTKSEVNGAVRWLLETVLAMAAVFSGQPDRFAGLRVNAEARLNLGPMSTEDQKLVGELVDKELISRETGMGRIGIEDTDAEKGRIRQEREEKGQSLAASLLKAQSQLDGGQQSNGVEQPVGANG